MSTQPVASQEDLDRGFAAFVAAAQRLESSYAALAARAEAVDLELATTNASLEKALGERESLLAALPLGVVAIGAAGDRRFTNAEAERVCALARAHGVDLCAERPGEVRCGELCVRLRRLAFAGGELVLLEDRSRLAELESLVHRLDRLAGLSELALGVAHEIKNPLNGVMGFAALLERSDDPATMRRFAGKIRQGLTQVDEIVRALLAFARPEQSRGKLEPVAASAQRAATIAGLPGARLRLTGATHEVAEAGALTTVFTNLFKNSLEAAGGAVNVQVRAELAGQDLVLHVGDDGPGVPREIGRRVLEPFVSTKERGTGLGLALAARVLGYLHGSLDLADAGGRGAHFVIRVPRTDPLDAERSDGRRVGAAG